jgi:hypothetical protein
MTNETISSRDGMSVDASDVANLTCPKCGEKLGLNADKPAEGVDHPDCKTRVGIKSPPPTANQFVVTVSTLEVPIRTFEEDKAARKQEAKGAKAAETGKEDTTATRGRTTATKGK